jgi:hypothetical protein
MYRRLPSKQGNSNVSFEVARPLDKTADANSFFGSLPYSIQDGFSGLMGSKADVSMPKLQPAEQLKAMLTPGALAKDYGAGQQSENMKTALADLDHRMFGAQLGQGYLNVPPAPYSDKAMRH